MMVKRLKPGDLVWLDTGWYEVLVYPFNNFEKDSVYLGVRGPLDPDSPYKLELRYPKNLVVSVIIPDR